MQYEMRGNMDAVETTEEDGVMTFVTVNIQLISLTQTTYGG
jgi:hypothetical protein